MMPLNTACAAILVLALTVISTGTTRARSQNESVRVLDRGRNHKVIEVTRQTTDEAGQQFQTIGHYTVLKAGMHRRDSSGNWLESQPTVAQYAQGFVFSGAAHRLILSKNLNTAGSVDYQASDGQRIVSNPLAIYYYDPETGQTVKIGTLKDCAGEITASNQVTYADCFSGPVGRVSITYTYTCYGLHQDLKFQEQPPHPSVFGLGSNSRIETATELLDFPSPNRTVHVLRDDPAGVPDAVDETLSFGSTRLTLGFAFPSDAPGRKGIPVAKRLTAVQGRTLILESLPWQQALKELDKLPEAAEQAALEKPEVSPVRELPQALMAQHGTTSERNALQHDFESHFAAVTQSEKEFGEIQLAALSSDASKHAAQAGFVIDPVYLDSSMPNYTFLSGETYVVDGYVHADNPTFQSGAIFKSEPGANFTISGQVSGPGSGTVVFTSVEDDSIGFDVDFQPAMPATRNAQYALALYYTPAMYLPFSVDIRHAQTGLYLYGNNLVVSGSFWNCGLGAYAEAGEISFSAEVCAVDVPYDSSPYGSVAPYVNVCRDSDSDGMPDVWEQIYGLNPYADDTLGDVDGDLLSNWEEYYWWGTDPGDAHSWSLTRNDGEFHLTAVTGEGGTRASVTVDQAVYNPGNDTTDLQFTVASAFAEEHDIYLYDSAGQFWKNVFASFLGEDPFTGNVFYGVTAKGNQTSATFAALSRYDDDFDGLDDGYEIKMTQTVVGNPDSSSAFPGIPATDGNGIADSDEDFDSDGLPTAQEWLLGTHPLVAESSADSDGDGLPNWFEIVLGGSAVPWDDSDGDGVPNIVEFDIGSNPVVPDFGGYFPPPGAVYPEDPNAVSAEVVSVQLNDVPYSAANGPSGNTYFTTAGFSLGPLGVTAGMTAIPSDFGDAGVAQVRLDIMPVQDLYFNVWPFTDDGTPEQGEVQRPDPADGIDYRALLLQATSIAGTAAGFVDTVWGQIDEQVLQAMRQRTLEYLSATTKMRISYYCREIQWLEYHRLSVGDQPGLQFRIQRRLSIVHTEMTKSTAIHMRYVNTYPSEGARYFSKVLKGVQWLSFAVNLPSELEVLRERIIDYLNDVRNQQDTAGPALLSVKLQEFLSSIPGMPSGLIVTTTPIFDPCPLGMYEGGGGCF